MCARALMLGVMIVTDMARFAGDDAEPLVSASFVCPYCLDLPSQITLNLDEPYGSVALCHCHACSRGWAVTLSFNQSMRMALAPPADLELTPA
jgi:hypothetical protein